MDFTSALLYPFKSIAKVLTIVLVITIAVAMFIGMLLNSYDWVGFIRALQYNLSLYGSDYQPANPFPFYETPIGMFIPAIIGLFIVGIMTWLWSSGYSIRVIRHVMDGYEKLPNIQLGKDMMTGIYLFLLNLFYGVIFFVFLIAVGILAALFTGSNSGGGLSSLIVLGAFFVSIPLLILMGWAYFIGMARYAADDDRSALFQLGTNLSIARQNVKISFSLTGYLVLLGLTFLFVSQFASNVLQLFATPFFGSNQDQTSILIAIVGSFMMSLALNIVQEFSRMHLVAQYAYHIGLYDDFDDYDGKKVDFNFD
jgi:hypothetical protein